MLIVEFANIAEFICRARATALNHPVIPRYNPIFHWAKRRKWHDVILLYEFKAWRAGIFQSRLQGLGKSLIEASESWSLT